MSIFGAAESDVRSFPARGNGGVIPDHILGQRIVEGFAANLVPGLVGARRRVEFDAEVLHGLIARRVKLLDQFPNVPHHLQNAVGTRAVRMTIDRLNLMRSYISKRRVADVSPRERPAVRAASRLLPLLGGR